MRNKRKAETPPEGVRRSGRLRTLTDKKAAEEEAAVAMANESAAEKSATAPLGKPKRFRRPRQRKKCGFLNKLPGELRNNIYRHVLLQPEEIEVTPAGPGEPALLHVCKRLRSEARGIYYMENSFKLKIVGFNGAEFSGFRAQYFSYYNWTFSSIKTRGSNVSLNLRWPPNWTNLIEWIKDSRTHAFAFQQCIEDTVEDNFDAVSASAWRINDALVHQPWATVEKALKAMRLALSGTDSMWSEEMEEFL